MTASTDPSPWVGEFPGLAPWPGVDDFALPTASAPPPFESSTKEALVAEGYKLTVSLKGKAQSDPWTVVNANTPKELHELLEGLHAEGVHTAVGRAQTAYQTGLLMGSKLGATTVSVETSADEAPEAVAKPAAAKRPATAKKAPVKKEAPASEPAAEEPTEEPAPEPEAPTEEAPKAAPKVPRPAPGGGAPRPKWAKQ